MCKKFGSLLLAITAFLAGNTEAWGMVYTHFEGEVRKVASFELRDSCDVDDVVQQSFLDAFESPGRFRTGWDGTVDHFKRWLCRIVRHRCCRVRAERDGRCEVPLDDENQHADSRLPLEVLEEAEEVQVTLSAVALADSVGTQALCLRVLDGLSAPQVATRLGVKRQTVYNRMSQAAKRFRKVYAQRQMS